VSNVHGGEEVLPGRGQLSKPVAFWWGGQTPSHDQHHTKTETAWLVGPGGQGACGETSHPVPIDFRAGFG